MFVHRQIQDTPHGSTQLLRLLDIWWIGPVMVPESLNVLGWFVLNNRFGKKGRIMARHQAAVRDPVFSQHYPVFIAINMQQ
jgi:hypothetical protein